MDQITINEATLYLGDCREIIPTLPRVDAVVTDPPYGVDFKYESHKDDRETYGETIVPRLLEAEERVENGWCAVYQSATRGPDWGAWFQRAWRPIAMPKTFSQVHPGKWPIAATDYVLLWMCGKPTWPKKGGRVRDWYLQQTANMALRERGHPCARPLDGVTHIVTHTCEPGGTVLDPFMGSGTTGVACANLGRRFIGIEMEPKYFDLACERITQAYNQRRLFDDAPMEQAALLA
jgi:site-specific DNA-methyltransferase (adenine-specific)